MTPPRNIETPISRDEKQFLKMKRDVYFEGKGGFLSTPIYDGDAMQVGALIYGPAIVEQRTTTIVVPPEAKLEVNPYGDYIMELPE